MFAFWNLVAGTCYSMKRPWYEPTINHWPNMVTRLGTCRTRINRCPHSPSPKRMWAPDLMQPQWVPSLGWSEHMLNETLSVLILGVLRYVYVCMTYIQRYIYIDICIQCIYIYLYIDTYILWFFVYLHVSMSSDRGHSPTIYPLLGTNKKNVWTCWNRVPLNHFFIFMFLSFPIQMAQFFWGYTSFSDQ